MLGSITEKNMEDIITLPTVTRIVKGLIGLLLGACQGKTSDEIHAFDPHAYFEQLGLAGQLSPSRTNGLNALAKAIKDAAQ